MPKASMNENHFLAARENQIRFAGKRCAMQAVPEAAAMQKASDSQFGLGIASTNPSHAFAALLATQSVHCQGVAVS
jgi:hypothetical protein